MAFLQASANQDEKRSIISFQSWQKTSTVCSVAIRLMLSRDSRLQNKRNNFNPTSKRSRAGNCSGFYFLNALQNDKKINTVNVLGHKYHAFSDVILETI